MFPRIILGVVAALVGWKVFFSPQKIWYGSPIGPDPDKETLKKIFAGKAPVRCALFSDNPKAGSMKPDGTADVLLDPFEIKFDEIKIDTTAPPQPPPQLPEYFTGTIVRVYDGSAHNGEHVRVMG